MKGNKRYLVLLIALLALTAIGLLVRFLHVRYTPGHADQTVVEITAETTNSYVDATQAIKDGITQLTSAGGGVLFFGPGKYLVQQTIDIPSNITIQGVGAGEVGPTMIILGNNGDLNATGLALLSIVPGAENVAIKDVELRSMTPGPNVYPRSDLDRIRDEQTTAIRMYGDNSTHTRNIQFQNLRITNFTYGIDAGSNDGSNPAIDNVQIKNVASPVNYWAMRVRSLNARNWDVQNFNIVEIAQGESGIKLERTGKMSFLQLFCASTGHNGDLCLDIGQRSGALYFVQAGYEGPQQGFRISSASTYPIYFELSAMTGTVEQNNTIYSFANQYSSDNSIGRINFTGNGTQSTLYRCGDVFADGFPTISDSDPVDPYPGLASVPASCNFDVTTISNPFSDNILPFGAFNWIKNGTSPSAAELNVKNFGATGDGVTDDTAAFRAAITGLNTGFFSASTVIVPAGNYKVSDTLVLKDGITVQGEDGANIKFTPTDRPLFQVRALSSDTIIKRGIGVKNLSLTDTNPSAVSQNATAIDLSGNRGAAGDFIFSDLNISGFARGVYVHNDSGQADDQQPEFDTIAVRSSTFTGNATAIELHDDNASNWDIADIQISGMKAGQKGIKIDRGGAAIRNVSCHGESSQNLAGACLYISRIAGLWVDHLTSSNTQYAFYGEWPLGWTPYSVVIKNSDLRDGFYSAGKMYLLSVGNTYADGGQGSPLGSRTTFFNVYGSDDALNVHPGVQSRITSCGDTFRNSSGATAQSLMFVGLTDAAQTCGVTSTDTTDPSVSITAPSSGATLAGSSVAVSATANDNVGVAGVQFKLDNNNLGSEDTSSPYGVTWNTTGVSNGSHSLTAIARDAAGNTTTSSSVVVTVNNIPTDTTPPTVSITAPANNATVSGSSVAVSANASDNVGVIGVQFKLDGSNLGAEDTSLPYSTTWDTTAVSNSSHALTAIARDAAGNSTLSTITTVTVNNVVPPTTVATPSILPNGGSFTSTQSVTISTTTSGANIRYTTDGSTPSSTAGTVYTTAFNISTTATVKAIAYKAGSNDSSVASATFTITPPATVTAPTISPDGGSFTSAQSVSISTTTAGAIIHFTTDGSAPNSSSTTYNGAISISTTTTVKALAVKSGMTDSATASAVFTITIAPPGTVVTPAISPNGGSFTSTQSVTLSTTTSGATIYYTTNGSTPTTASTQYSAAFSVPASATVKAVAIKSGMTDSSIASATFTITNPPPPPSGGSGSGGGSSSGGGGGHSNPPSNPPTPPNIPPSIPSVILPPNVIAGQVIKFSNSPTIYLVQSTGLHPFDTWNSFLAYQTQSGAQVITRAGTTSTYTISSTLAKTVLGQTQSPSTPPPATGLPTDQANFVCLGSKTVYFYYHGKKEAYSEPALYEAWNGKNYSSIQTIDASTCNSIPDNGIVRLPEGTIIRVFGGPEIYMISGNTAKPFASLSAYQRDSAGKTTYTISLSYLHTYSRGQIIY